MNNSATQSNEGSGQMETPATYLDYPETNLVVLLYETDALYYDYVVTEPELLELTSDNLKPLTNLEVRLSNAYFQWPQGPQREQYSFQFQSIYSLLLAFKAIKNAIQVIRMDAPVNVHNLSLFTKEKYETSILREMEAKYQLMLTTVNAILTWLGQKCEDYVAKGRSLSTSFGKIFKFNDSTPQGKSIVVYTFSDKTPHKVLNDHRWQPYGQEFSSGEDSEEESLGVPNYHVSRQYNEEMFRRSTPNREVLREYPIYELHDRAKLLFQGLNGPTKQTILREIPSASPILPEHLCLSEMTRVRLGTESFQWPNEQHRTERLRQYVICQKTLGGLIVGTEILQNLIVNVPLLMYNMSMLNKSRYEENTKTIMEGLTIMAQITCDTRLLMEHQYRKCETLKQLLTTYTYPDLSSNLEVKMKPMTVHYRDHWGRYYGIFKLNWD
jgi:hypothetical protein